MQNHISSKKQRDVLVKCLKEKPAEAGSGVHSEHLVEGSPMRVPLHACIKQYRSVLCYDF